eukprot:TRINITY_DN16471_c0_g1_i2.p1 TRINITY_DN16471_c0_g1~~TRINITY_DN16471_c0_g1_i2.p1  ORF type:complete len:202 (-),score=22.87 TRINITY_DN16471_c0_g1_i2:215-820(-)
MRSTKRAEPRNQRGCLIKGGTKMRKTSPGECRAGRHSVSFSAVHPRHLDCFFAVAYTDRTLHAGVLLRAPGPQIRATWCHDTSSQLLAHLLVVRNIVCLKFDLSDTMETASEDMRSLDHLGPDAKTEFVFVGQTTEEHLAGAAALASEEIDKPLFPLSRAEEDTSCLHFSMRMLHQLGCMPEWDWLVEQLPDAPLVRRSKL